MGKTVKKSSAFMALAKKAVFSGKPFQPKVVKGEVEYITLGEQLVETLGRKWKTKVEGVAIVENNDFDNSFNEVVVTLNTGDELRLGRVSRVWEDADDAPEDGDDLIDRLDDVVGALHSRIGSEDSIRYISLDALNEYIKENEDDDDDEDEDEDEPEEAPAPKKKTAKKK